MVVVSCVVLVVGFSVGAVVVVVDVVAVVVVVAALGALEDPIDEKNDPFAGEVVVTKRKCFKNGVLPPHVTVPFESHPSGAVRMLSTRVHTSPASIELTSENMEWVRRELVADVQSETFQKLEYAKNDGVHPDVPGMSDYPDIKWRACRRSYQFQYTEGGSSRKRLKTLLVPHADDPDTYAQNCVDVGLHAIELFKQLNASSESIGDDDVD